MGTVGGYAKGMDGLPWSKKRPHALADLATTFQQRQLAEDIAKFIVLHGFTQVITPTHLITGPDDPWLAINIASANALRVALERNGAMHIQLHYSLALSYEAFRTVPKRLAVRGATAPSHGRWAVAEHLQLRIRQLADSHHSIRGCRSGLSRTRYADRRGPCRGPDGLVPSGVRRCGGLSHGVTLGERFDTASWHKVPEAGKAVFGAKMRVYLPTLDLMLPRVDVERFFEAGGGRARSAFGCRDTNCCRRGIDDMLQAPARHFLYQRMQQVAGLGQIPESIRPTEFLEDHLRPASDAALIAAKLALPEDLAQKAAKQAKRLNDMRTTLAPYAKKRRDSSFARHPVTRIARGGTR